MFLTITVCQCEQKLLHILLLMFATKDGMPYFNVNSLHVGATPLSRAVYGAGTGSIWLDNVLCAGSETRLIDCTANAIGSHNCGHSEDASVRCVVPGMLFIQFSLSSHTLTLNSTVYL